MLTPELGVAWTASLRDRHGVEHPVVSMTPGSIGKPCIFTSRQAAQAAVSTVAGMATVVQCVAP